MVCRNDEFRKDVINFYGLKMALLSSAGLLMSQTHFGQNLESTDGSVSMDSNDFRERESPNLDENSCTSNDTVLSVGNENPNQSEGELSFKNIESHLNAISKITNSTLDPELSRKSSPSPLSQRYSPVSVRSISGSPGYENTLFRQSVSPVQTYSGPDSSDSRSPKPQEGRQFFFKPNVVSNNRLVINNNEPPHGNLKFSIDNILKADFGRRITDPIHIRKSKPKKVGKLESKSLEDSGKGPVDLSKSEAVSEKATATASQSSNTGSSSSTSEGSSGGSQPILWPAWVYCTRYSDRPSSGK